MTTPVAETNLRVAATDAKNSCHVWMCLLQTDVRHDVFTRPPSPYRQRDTRPRLRASLIQRDHVISRQLSAVREQLAHIPGHPKGLEKIMASLQPPTPSPSPPPPPPMSTFAQRSTLPGQISTATRIQHTKLNRLIIQRLPFALPPHTDTPLLFGKGLVPFARIFILFEAEWDLLRRHAQIQDGIVLDHAHDVTKWLANLRPKGLTRTQRLRRDLKHLRVAGGSSIFTTSATDDPWLEEMRGLLRRRPHVFVAFAWVFYMAVFSGGRWVRQQLADAGTEFWTQPHATTQLEKGEQPPSLEIPGFSFLSFDSDMDGEDLKTSFKSRLAEGETLLTSDEKQDVVDTAQQLFDQCIVLVNELDRMVLREKIRSSVPKILMAMLCLVALGWLSIHRPSRFSDFRFALQALLP